MLNPKLDALIADYNSRISTLEKLNRDYLAEKAQKLKELDKKTKNKIKQLEKERESLEAGFGSEINKFYEDFGAQKKQLENKINREANHVQDWNKKFTKSKDIIEKLEAEKSAKTEKFNEQLAGLENDQADQNSKYKEVIERLLFLDQQARTNYDSLNNMPPLDIDKITHESVNKRSAYTNEMLWAQIHNANETFTLSNKKIELDKVIQKLGKQIAKANDEKEKFVQLMEAELKEPYATYRYNEKNLKKYKDNLAKTRKDLQALLDTEDPFKKSNEVDKKKAIEKIKKKIAKVKGELPDKKKGIMKDYDAMIAANKKTIENLLEQLKKAVTMESQLKKRLDELK